MAGHDDEKESAAHVLQPNNFPGQSCREGGDPGAATSGLRVSGFPLSPE